MFMKHAVATAFAAVFAAGAAYAESNVIGSVETNAKDCTGGVRAELFDGTDTVPLVWLGQRRIPGIECGRNLRVHGRVGMLDNGSKAIYNPHYEIQR